MDALNTAPASDVTRRTRVLGLSLAQLIGWGSAVYSFAVFMEPLEAALAADRAQTSLAFSLALLAEGLAAFRVGRWVDAGHERAVMVAGALLIALGLALQALAQSLVLLYVAWSVVGVGMAAALYTPVFAVVTRRYPRSYRRDIIVLTFLGGLASTVFIPLTAALVSGWGWRAASLALAACNLLVCAPLHWILLRDAPPAAPTRPRVAGGSRDPAFAAHLHGPVFWRLGAFTILLMAVTAAVPPHLVSLLRESGLSMAWAIALPASIGVLQVLGRAVLFFGEGRIGVDATDHWIPLLLPAALLVLLLGSGHVPAALLFALLYGLGNGMLTIVKGTVVARYVSIEYVGALNGALGLPLALARALTPLVVGLLWSPGRGYAWGLALLIVLGVLGVAALWSAQAKARALAVP